MNKKDREEIRQIVAAAVAEALTVEWTVERRRDERTGQPLAVPETRRERVFLPSAIVQLLPYHEGALRGLQQDFARAHIAAHGENLSALVALIEQAQPVLKKLAWFADLVERQQARLLEPGPRANGLNGPTDEP
jgi:hypothetical protein